LTGVILASLCRKGKEESGLQCGNSTITGTGTSHHRWLYKAIIWENLSNSPPKTGKKGKKNS
jgi:hypothetical protein